MLLFFVLIPTCGAGLDVWNEAPAAQTDPVLMIHSQHRSPPGLSLSLARPVALASLTTFAAPPSHPAVAPPDTERKFTQPPSQVQAAVGLGGRSVPLEQRRRGRSDGFLAGAAVAAAAGAAQRERSAGQERAEAQAGLGSERPRWRRRKQQPVAVRGYRTDGPLPVLLLKRRPTQHEAVCLCVTARAPLERTHRVFREPRVLGMDGRISNSLNLKMLALCWLLSSAHTPSLRAPLFECWSFKFQGRQTLLFFLCFFLRSDRRAFNNHLCALARSVRVASK